MPMDQRWLPDEVLSGVRVVLVEANSDDRAVLTALLSMYGADVRAVSCAREAVGLLHSAAPAVVVCDPGVAAEDGVWLLHQARACSNEDGRTRRILGLSSTYTARDSSRVLALGFDGFLSKPVDVQVFCAMVADLARPEV